MQRRARWRGVRCLVLGVVGSLAVTIGHSTVVRAQTLAVRPHEMAIATRTEHAGWHTLDGELLPVRLLPEQVKNEWKGSLDFLRQFPDTCCYTFRVPLTSDWERDTAVYVPKACVGIRKCPLLIMTNVPEVYYSRLAEKYEMLVAALPAAWSTAEEETVDQNLRRILGAFAIDPDKIAIAGRCATGAQTAEYGTINPAVFSRVLVGTHDVAEPPRGGTPTQEHLVGSSVDELENIAGVQRLRARGYPVTYSLQFRGHDHTDEEYDFWGRWLHERWAIPQPAARPQPFTLGAPPLLTVDIVTRMTAFWNQFKRLPDSIKTTARLALVREVLLSLGKEQISTLMVDMPALAAKYPAVAATFRAVQLAPTDHEIYRAALLSARAYNQPGMGAEEKALLGIEPTSAWAQNGEFIKAHPDEWAALEATRMWNTP